jgi:pimeloyl-ACP methyl ester carboxylesterase
MRIPFVLSSRSLLRRIEGRPPIRSRDARPTQDERIFRCPPRTSGFLLVASTLLAASACCNNTPLVVPLDAGLGDAGPPGGTFTDGGVTCQELGALNIWAPVAAPLPLPGDLGEILACVHVGSFSQAELQAATLSDAANGYELYDIQYVSQGPIGTPVLVTGLLYAPSGNPDAGTIPLVGLAHGTSGMGPNCGPTHFTAYTDYMALPIVAHGWAVVATDYPGMGVDDGAVSPYLVGSAEAYSILDSVRAAFHFHDSLFDSSSLSGELFFAGHSQGGQATLFAHQLYDPSVGGTLLGSVSWAPALGDPRELGQLMTADTLTLGTGTLVAMGLYGNMSYYGTPAASSWLSSSAQAQLPSILYDQCLVDGSTVMSAIWPTLGELLQPAFLGAAAACPLDGGACPGFAPWATELEGDVPGGFTSSAPALIMQGEADTLVLPETTACIEARLEANGTPEETCGYLLDNHLTIVTDSMSAALTWMDGRRNGQSPDVCPAPLAETCTP